MIRNILSASAIMAAMAVGVAALPASAAPPVRPTTIDCPAGSTKVINPSTQPLVRLFAIDPRTRISTNIAVPAGTLRIVNYLSWDGYETRITTTQLFEQWAVEIIGSPTVQTALTADVPDRVIEGTATGSLPDIVTNGGTVDFVHSSIVSAAANDGNYNSVHPIGFCYTIQPAATTTTSTTTTTTTTALPDVTTTTAATTTTTLAATPCVTIKRYVRQTGTTGPFLDAQTPEAAALIANGTTAEYQIVVTNCGTTDLTNVTVTDTIPGCNKTIGNLAPGATTTYTTATDANNTCNTPNATNTTPTCGTATVTAQQSVNGVATGPTLTASDPACITTTALPTTPTGAATTLVLIVPPVTQAPVTQAPVTQAPTTTPPVSAPAASAAPLPTASVLSATILATATTPVATTEPPTTVLQVKVLGKTIAQSTEGTLPVTGQNSATLLMISAGLMTLGLAILFSGRLKRRQI